jgi:electron transport complex protein RnfD
MTRKPSTAIEISDTPVIHVSHSPHITNDMMTTRRMMMDVLIALIPSIAMAIAIFRLHAVKQIAICLATCMAAEAVFVKLRRKPFSLTDGSAAVTGLILGLSIPAPAPWYIGIIASVVAVGIGKTVFGGLGMNLFNPAMVGRAFVMISFAGVMAASGYEDVGSVIDAVTRATPLNAIKQMGMTTSLSDLFWGFTNGSPGEVSAAACLLGGIYLCIRRTASWEIPAGMLAVVLLLGTIGDLTGPPDGWSVWHHLCSGALLFGAFFIATDPATSPLAPLGKFIYGVGIGCLVMILRWFSGYPEGVMFAVLLMNAVTPLINRWTIPKTMGEQ